MRAKIVDKYIKKVLKQDPKWVSVVEQIIKFNIDNRILNNLRQELNEQITDTNGLVELSKFKKMFFTFFKGESKAFLVFDKLWPCIREYYDFISNRPCEKGDPNATEVARISQLTSFIDLFNYYPM